MTKTRFGAMLAAAGVVLVGATVADGTTRTPTLVNPPNGKEVKVGSRPTFTARTRPDATVILEVSKSRKRGRDRTIGNDAYLRVMNPKPGGKYQRRADSYPDLDSYFLNRPGTYYWQVHRINCREQKSNDPNKCTIPSKVNRIVVVE